MANDLKTRLTAGKKIKMALGSELKNLIETSNEPKTISHLYFVITQNCNLKCRHCYLSAGPGKLESTISEEEFRKVIGNLPQERVNLQISGGEIFTLGSRLYSYLRIVQEENERRADDQKIDLELQTNGFWGRNDQNIRKQLEQLSPYNIKKMDIASDDQYHRESGGLESEQLRRIFEIAESEFGLKVIVRGITPSDYLVPIGRARMSNFNGRISYFNGRISFQAPSPCFNFLSDYNHVCSIREDGSAYACCYTFFKLPGNVIKEPLDDIIEKAKTEPRLRALNRGGIWDLALYDGWDVNELSSLIENYGLCGFCARYYIEECKNK